MKKALTILFILSFQFLFSQKENSYIAKGNEAFNKGDYFLAETQYNKAIEQNNSNYIAYYNKGNALFKQNKYNAAMEAFSLAAKNCSNGLMKTKIYYNKGVTEAKEKKWADAVNSFKIALKNSPNDKTIRENLQLALDEFNKQHPKQQQQNSNNNSSTKNNTQPKLSKEQIENELDKLRSEEKRLQHEMQKKKVQKVLPDKDW